MPDCFSPQELSKRGRSIGGVPLPVLFERMRQGGVEICGIGAANLPLVSLLPGLGVKVHTVRDRAQPSPDILVEIQKSGARPLFGPGYLAGLSAPVIFRTPSLRPDTPELLAARERGAVVLTEAALTLAMVPCELFAITGSDGKTTTAMLTAAMLRAAGRRVHLGGNIGTPLFSALPSMKREDAAVLELSSFQLMDLAPPEGRCAVTCLSENHLDWHSDFSEYAAAKARILGGGTAVLPYDEALLAMLAYRGDVCYFGEVPPEDTDHPAVFPHGDTVVLSEGGRLLPLFPASLAPRGAHNFKNAMTAAALTLGSVPCEAMAAALASFSPPPHRASFLGHFRGVACYDSSIDTTPSRTAVTLASFPSPPYVLVGGRGKRLSYRPLAEALLAFAVGAVITGEDRIEMANALAEVDPDGRFPFLVVADFTEATALALTLAEPCGCLLLSPAATSHDVFPDYRARGRAFAEILAALS